MDNVLLHSNVSDAGSKDSGSSTKTVKQIRGSVITTTVKRKQVIYSGRVSKDLGI